VIFLLQFGFSQFVSFREEDLWNFSQSEHRIGPGSHIEYPSRTKNSNFVEDHPRNIPAKFGSNGPSGFGEEAWNVKSLQTTDDGCQVMAIVHLDLWSRWTKKAVERRGILDNYLAKLTDLYISIACEIQPAFTLMLLCVVWYTINNYNCIQSVIITSFCKCTICSFLNSTKELTPFHAGKKYVLFSREIVKFYNNKNSCQQFIY
jgi:hypothetical protein